MDWISSYLLYTATCDVKHANIEPETNLWAPECLIEISLIYDYFGGYYGQPKVISGLNVNKRNQNRSDSNTIGVRMDCSVIF
jgi:hypothetical protein